MRLLLVLAATAGLGACVAHDPAELPAPRPVPAAWTQSAAPSPETLDERWWRTFGDPVLDALAEAAGDTDDTALAEARLAEATARLTAARGALAPQVGAAVSAEVQRVDDLEIRQVQGLFALALNPDLNGAVRARRGAAQAGVEAEAERLRAVRLASRATAVRLYAAFREAEARAEAAERSAAALAELVQIAEARSRAGLGSGLDPAAARAALAAARARPIAAREAADAARLGLEALLGRPPGGLTAMLAQGSGVPAPAGQAAAPTPAEVLVRRPDLRAAERALAAAGLDAEAARRDFLPTLSLEAGLGARGADPVTPFTPEGALLRAGAGLAAPLLTGGRLEAARDAADARRTAAALAWRKAAAGALAEVETAFSASRGAERRVAALSEAVAAAGEQTALAESRWRSGVGLFVEVLAARRTLADAEADLAGARGDLARARTALAAASGLGGQPGR